MPHIYTDGRADTRWWIPNELEDEVEVGVSNAHSRLLPVVKFLRNRSQLRRKYDLLHARIYGNLRFQGFGLNTYTQMDGVEDERLTYNICKNMVQAVVSRITKNRPKAKILTSGKDWILQNKASLLEGFVDGQLYRTKFRERAVDVFRDCCIYGTGALKIFRAKNDIRAERVPPWMLLVDDAECLTGEPRNLYERKYVDKAVLIDLFAKDDPALEKLIMDCRLGKDEEGDFGSDTASDQVLVTEAWHLPSGRGADDGRHVICIDNVTLVDDPWTDDCFPFVFIRWSKAPAGFFGIGLISELIGIQTEINKLLRQIQQAHHLCAWPRMLVPRGARVVKSHLNNGIGAIIEFDGAQPPTQATFPTVPQEIYEHLRFLIKSAYEVAGISQLTATAAKPAGIESGIALSNLMDVQSDRFTEIGHAWEDLFRDGAEHIIRLSRDISKSKPDYAVQSVGDEELEEVSWDEAVMELDQYVLQVFPTSMLPETPAGRLQFVENLSNMLEMDQEESFALINFPDLKAFRNRRLASRDAVEKDLASIYRTGKYTSPEPYDDLAFAFKRSGEMISEARRREAPEHVQAALRRYNMAADRLLNPPLPPPPPSPVAPAEGMQPGGPPPEGALPPMPGPSGTTMGPPLPPPGPVDPNIPPQQ